MNEAREQKILIQWKVLKRKLYDARMTNYSKWPVDVEVRVHVLLATPRLLSFR